jgi:3-hydroxybutyryl-CoA dehydrogenase
MTMEIRTIGVVGAGTMGAGIAQVCAQAGYSVILSEINQALLDKGLSAIGNSLTRLVEKAKLSDAGKVQVLNRLKGITDLKDFASCNIVIEAIIEDLEAKKQLFKTLDDICSSDTILATNTSCLSVTDIAMSTKRSDKILGIHFFNPVPVMALIEIVSTIRTSEETLRIGEEFGKSLGKTVIKAKDAPGFIVNRLAMPFILNAIRLFESGAASREDIDTSIKLGLNHPIGPLSLADLIGLDIIYNIVKSIYDELKDPQYAPPVLLKKMVAAGWLGRKSGKGFYDYR